MSFPEVGMSCRRTSLSMSHATHEDVAVLGECSSCGRDSSLNRLVLVYVSGAVSLSCVDVAFNILDLGVVDL